MHTKQSKVIYKFGKTAVDGHAGMKNTLGGKGANLAEMAKMGLPVPPGYTITTDMCLEYYKAGNKVPESVIQGAHEGMEFIGGEMNLKFGDPKRPLLVSVRSGSPVSMPGMMDTILNLGLCESTLPGMRALFNNDRFVYDAYRRFIQMFSDVVLDINREHFEAILHKTKHSEKVKNDNELSAAALESICHQYLDVVKERGIAFPQDPWEQLIACVNAVFKSWYNPRAKTYRKLNRIPETLGTAVNIQAMVFGNMNETCATGVTFTRDPATGQNTIYGEYLVNAQGEDVVAGIRTPHPIVKTPDDAGNSLEEVMPDMYKQLADTLRTLEQKYKDMQDVEFTVQEGKLYILQTRNGKRTAQAAINVAIDMVKEGILTKAEAINHVDGNQISNLLHPQIRPGSKFEVVGTGLAASPGVASGMVVFNSDSVKVWTEDGKKVILVRNETSPEDIEGMSLAQGILTAQGGMTSHAAVVARGMGKCCVAGCGSLHIDFNAKRCELGGIVFKEGDTMSLNGTTGEVIKGAVETIPAVMDDNFKLILTWADEARRLKVRANADTPEDARRARDLGAQGIGLCRTEHMFFEEERILTFRKMILSDTLEDRQKELAELKKHQVKDFEGIFREMSGLPVTVRLLDPPLHEFLPTGRQEIEYLAQATDKSVSWVETRIHSLHELNPMLGHRGVRLGVTYPEVYQMQVEAIIEAAINIKAKEKVTAIPEIMIPLAFGVNELKYMREKLEESVQTVFKKLNASVDYKIGTMIEVPRAAIVAKDIAEVADFFSFGTNDLTQMTFGISRDDGPKFIPRYVDERILSEDPFVSLDQDGVGWLMKWAVESAKGVSGRNLHYGICGEHGGEARSVHFCHQLGLDYVSCSPFRVPVARLAAGQAAAGAQNKGYAATV